MYKFENDLSKFEQEVLVNDFDKVEAIYNQYNDFFSFKKAILNNENTRMTQLAGVLGKNDRSFLKGFLKEGYISISTDDGSITVGNDSFKIGIPNGYGDTRTHIGFANKGEINSSAFIFLSVIEGKFNIYDQCGSVKEIEGKYSISYGNGIIIFERWD